ncbi:hypothetical protein [Natronohydrobacter thiooxidans]|uniref:hypothetical protein n=1 Tax=Natronohydrobacter thiooxidans TaxID=87172 RepID=UPI000A5B7781|nr:hypothetical protein [Natronohydrobacter thiooxidans]
MSHDWLIETLNEALRYAREQDLLALSAHLEQAIQLAHLEIAQTSPSGHTPRPGAGKG